MPVDDLTRQNKSLFDRFAKAFVRGDEAELNAILSKDFIWNMPTGQVHSGREAVIKAIRKRQAAPDKPRFSDSKFEIHGNTAVQTYKVKVRGPNGRMKTLDGCDVYKVRRGRIARKDAYWKQIVS